MAIKKRPDRYQTKRVYQRADRENVCARWWVDKDPQALARNVFGVAEAIEHDQGPQIENALRCARAYSGQNLTSLYDNGYVRGLIDRATALLGFQIPLNVVRSIVETVVNKVGKTRVRIQVTSKGGNWSIQTKSKKLTRFLDGAFDDGPNHDVYTEIRKAFRDALVFGTGFVYVYQHDDGDGYARPRAERVLDSEVQVSDGDGVYGRPRSMFRKRYVAREVLLAEYGDLPGVKEALEKATQVDPTDGKEDLSSDRVLVREAWHLPSTRGADDGLYAVCVEGHCLWQQPWKRDSFPFAVIRCTERIAGFRGEGMVEQLIGLQWELTKTIQTVARGLHLMAVPRVFVKPGTQVSPAQINNQIGAVVRATEAPVFHEGGKVSDQVIDYIAWIIKQMYEVSGVSQLGAAGKIPAGMADASGEALRQMEDIQSDRFAALQAALEELTKDVANLILDEAKDIVSDGDGTEKKKLIVRAKTTRGIEDVDFRDVDMDRDKFMIQPFPTSFLPNTPAARVQRLQELVDLGWISAERAMSYAQMPDFDDDLSLMSVSVDLTKQQIERMLEHGEDVLPVEYQNQELALEMATNAYLRGVLDGAPEAHLEKIQRYLDELDYIKAEMPAPVAPAGNPMELAQAAQATQAVDPNAAMTLAQQAAAAPMASAPAAPAAPALA